MKIRTLIDLTDSLSRDLAWRKKEITAMRAVVENPKTTRRAQDAALRAGLALLYAHFEGFIKTGGDSYLEYLSRKKLPLCELQDNFIAIFLHSKIASYSTTNKISLLKDAVDSIRNNLSSNQFTASKRCINTKSNLNYETLYEILFSLGLDNAEYEKKRMIINERLLSNRNQIAHGEFCPIDQENYAVLNDEIISLLNLFKNQIENAAAQLSYKISAA